MNAGLAVDLFCGAGGATLGLHRAGYDVALAVDYDADAVATHRAAHPGVPVLQADLSALDRSALPEHAALWWASPPCQPHSTAGKRLQGDDARDGWPWLLRLLRSGPLPRSLVCENVAGMTDRRGRPYLDALLLDLASLGWPVAWRVLDSADVGVPQHRRRLIIRCGEAARWPWPTPTHGPMRAAPWASLGDACPGLQYASAHLTYPLGTGRAGSEPERLRRPAPTVVTVEVKGTRACRATGWTFHGGPDRASDAAFLATGRRRLTVEECAVLQDFPADYPWHGNVTARYRQVGNACPAALVAAVVTPMNAVLAVDGGRTGAAVLLALDPGSDVPDLLAAFAWRVRGTRAPSYRLHWDTSEGIESQPAHTPYDLGAWVRWVLVNEGWRHHRVVVEDTFIGRNPRTAVVGARWSAQFAAALEGAVTSDKPILGGAAEWVLPDEWRAGALGIRRATKREDAKALTSARLPVGLVERVAPLAAELGDPEHLHDALGIGLWALGVQVVRPEPAKRPKRARRAA